MDTRSSARPFTNLVSGEAVLALLRKNPSDACRKYSFKVQLPQDPQTVGGRCTVRCEPLGKEVYKLIVTSVENGGDWYFPYVNTGGGVGECAVPIGQTPGTLALTGGMNGCALQVNRDAQNFYFYHDLNGTTLAQRSLAPPGERVCRVDSSRYPWATGQSEAQAIRTKSNGGKSPYFEFSMISVKTHLEWQVYLTGVMCWVDSATGRNPQYARLAPDFSRRIGCFVDSSVNPPPLAHLRR